VLIGKGARFWAAHSQIHIGNKALLGPDVTMIAGNHDMAQLGKFMAEVVPAIKDKNNDQDIRIDEDVWIGAGAIILTGVHVGRGAAVGAGSVVTRNVPPYAIVAGSPAKVLHYRWTLEQTLEHEKILYPKEKRFSSEELVMSRHQNRPNQFYPKKTP
ncbi:MAG: acyltransferase, partial [Pseudomonadota bacterium]